MASNIVEYKFYYIYELCYNNTWQDILELNNVMTITVTILNSVC